MGVSKKRFNLLSGIFFSMKDVRRIPQTMKNKTTNGFRSAAQKIAIRTP